MGIRARWRVSIFVKDSSIGEGLVFKKKCEPLPWWQGSVSGIPFPSQLASFMEK
jgi:hypothetical protein